jgi:MoaA/NifB/PqqE/SkfB family radical SAM enzyme
MIDILKQVGFAPRACVWELTLACNLRCKHCGSFAGSRRDDEMSLEESLQGRRPARGARLPARDLEWR